MMLSATLTALAVMTLQVDSKAWSVEEYSARPPKDAAIHALQPILDAVWQRRVNLALPSPIVSYTFFLKPEIAAAGMCSSSTFTVDPSFKTLGGGQMYFKYIEPRIQSANSSLSEVETRKACDALTTTSGFFLSDGYEVALKAVRRLVEINYAARGSGELPFELVIDGPLSVSNAREILAQLSSKDIAEARLTGETPPLDIKIVFEERSGAHGLANLSLVLKNEEHPEVVRLKYECCFVN